jgi:CheY-like chemotaxis protein
MGVNSPLIGATYATKDPTVRVLTADDQVHVLDALQLLVKNQGYCTEAVTDPARVLEALESERFDVVLVDMNYQRDTTAGEEGP